MSCDRHMCEGVMSNANEGHVAVSQCECAALTLTHKRTHTLSPRASGASHRIRQENMSMYMYVICNHVCADDAAGPVQCVIAHVDGSWQTCNESWYTCNES